MTTQLAIAKHDNPTHYWEGGHYELNLSFSSLRDKHWQRVMQTIWENPAMNGPLSGRYYPGQDDNLETTAIQTPPPTATMTQHGRIRIGDTLIGCDVQATRSLFECISILVPINMFDGIKGSPQMRKEFPVLEELDNILYSIALAVYDVAPFQIAALGYERECQLLSELKNDAMMRHNFLVMGNFLAQDEVLQAIEPDLTPYQEVRPNLRWLAPRL